MNPPVRSSSLRTFTPKPSGPHQDSMPSFVVHRSHTSSMAALYVRSILKVFFAMGLLLALRAARFRLLLERDGKAIQPRFPQLPITGHPRIELAKGLGAQ